MRLYLLGSLIKIDVVIVEYKEVFVILLNVWYVFIYYLNVGLIILWNMM